MITWEKWDASPAPRNQWGYQEGSAPPTPEGSRGSSTRCTIGGESGSRLLSHVIIKVNGKRLSRATLQGEDVISSVAILFFTV